SSSATRSGSSARSSSCPTTSRRRRHRAALAAFFAHSSSRPARVAISSWSAHAPTRQDAPPMPTDDLELLPGGTAVRVGGREVAVTRTQYRLLAALVAEPGRALSRAELVERGIGDLVEERTVDVHIKELRRKLGPDRWRIETVRGRGYRWRAN